MTLNAKIGGFMDLLRFQAATHVCIIHDEAPRYCLKCTSVWL